jgi:methyl-accepting chemotaxis protein
MRTPQMIRVSDITETIYSSTDHSDYAILAGDTETVRAEKKLMTAIRNDTHEQMERLKSLLTTEREKQLLQSIADKRRLYLATRDKLVVHALEGRKTEALQMLNVMKPLRKAFLDSLKELDSYALEQAGLVGDHAGVWSGRNWVVFKVLVTLAIAVMVILWILRSITVSLNAAAETASRIAEQDPTEKVETNDAVETGHLMTAMTNIVCNLEEVVTQTRNVATATNEQAAMTGETSGNVQPITESARQTAYGAHESAIVSAQLCENAEELQRLAQQFNQIGRMPIAS